MLLYIPQVANGEMSRVVLRVHTLSGISCGCAEVHLFSLESYKILLSGSVGFRKWCISDMPPCRRTDRLRTRVSQPCHSMEQANKRKAIETQNNRNSRDLRSLVEGLSQEIKDAEWASVLIIQE